MLQPRLIVLLVGILVAFCGCRSDGGHKARAIEVPAEVGMDEYIV